MKGTDSGGLGARVARLEKDIARLKHAKWGTLIAALGAILASFITYKVSRETIESDRESALKNLAAARTRLETSVQAARDDLREQIQANRNALREQLAAEDKRLRKSIESQARRAQTEIEATREETSTKIAAERDLTEARIAAERELTDKRIEADRELIEAKRDETAVAEGRDLDRLLRDARSKLRDPDTSVRRDGVSVLKSVARREPARHWEVMETFFQHLSTLDHGEGFVGASAEKGEGPDPRAVEIEPPDYVQEIIYAICYRFSGLSDAARLECEEQEKNKVLALRELDLRNVEFVAPHFDPQSEQRVTERAVLNGADFSGSNLQKASFAEADLRGTLFRSAVLWNAKFFDANLMDAKFERADLQKAGFESARLRDADFLGADLRQANLMEADLSESSFQDADLRGAYLLNVDLKGADLGGAHLEGTHLSGAQNSTKEQLAAAACWNADTRWPGSFLPLRRVQRCGQH